MIMVKVAKGCRWKKEAGEREEEERRERREALQLAMLHASVAILLLPILNYLTTSPHYLTTTLIFFEPFTSRA